MRGFQPKNYADGGLVQGVKRIFGMDEERNARVAAYRAQMAQEKAQQQAAQAQAQAAAPDRAISDYSGMGAMKRREKAAGLDYADGGMVRGPGTGTSDDVPDDVREGTYIMPADSTQALGPDQLAAMGARGFSPGGKPPGKKVPVNLSNGEFKMPPEQVHAIGVQALDQAKNATHQPVRGFAPKARPEEPRQFFADGGGVRPYRATGVDDEFMQSMAQSQNARRQQANATASESMAQSQASSDEAAQQAQAPAAPAIPQIGHMHSAGSRSGGQMLADGLTGAARGFFNSFQKDPEPAATPSPAGPRGMPDYKTDVQRGGGNVPAIDTAAAPAPAATSPQAPAAAPGPGDVTRVGNSYSGTNIAGDITVNGKAPGGGFMVAGGAQGGSVASPVGMSVQQAQQTGLVGERVGYDPKYDQRLMGNGSQPSAQNMAAADGLAARSQQESMARVTAQPAAGFQPAGVTAPTVRHSGNDWQSRNDLRNAMVSAKSIMNDGGKWDKHGKGVVSPERAYAMDLAKTDTAMRSAQPGVDVSTMRENAGIQREGMQQAGATDRAARGFAVDQQRLGIDSRRADSEIAVRGFQTRQAQQQEQLRNTLIDPNATQQQKAQAQAALQALSGKGDSWKAVALQGGTDAQGNKTESILGAVNERTGEMKRMEGQGGAQANPSSPPVAGSVQGGYRFKGGNPSDKANWERV